MKNKKCVKGSETAASPLSFINLCFSGLLKENLSLIWGVYSRHKNIPTNKYKAFAE